LVFSAQLNLFSRQDGVVALLSVDDFAFTPGPVRPGFMEIVGQVAPTYIGYIATLGGIDFNAPPPPETVPILLGTSMEVTVSLPSFAEYADGPTSTMVSSELMVTGVRDASGNPVPIFAASQFPVPTVPEPNEFAALGVSLLIGALAMRLRPHIGPAARAAGTKVKQT
jgi:hypothetical protein